MGFKKGEYKHSEETIKKMSEFQKLQKGKPKSEKFKQVRMGSGNPNWKGGKRKDVNGYVYIYMPNHPFTYKGHCVLEHRFVMEKHLGRTLLPTEVVHHINGITDDNRIENLMLFTNGEHVKLHQLKKNSNSKNKGRRVR